MNASFTRLTIQSTPHAEAQPPREKPKTIRRIYTCDICGCQMEERECKVVCKNCGNRFDCSDLTIYLD